MHRPLLALLIALTGTPQAAAQERIEHPDGNTYLVTGDFRGPGVYCDAGFLLRLETGDWVRILSPLIEYHRLRIELGGRQIEAVVGRREAAGRRMDRNGLRLHRQGRGFSYFFPAGQAFAEFESPHFTGTSRDDWFLRRLARAPGPDCLEGARR